MTDTDFEVAYVSGLLDGQYSNYIMENSHGDRPIGNGSMLIRAMEDAYLFDDFKASLVTE